MHVYYASRRTMHQHVCVHYTCRWGTQSRCQKFYATGLVGAKRRIPGLWRLSNRCILLLNSMLFSSCSPGFYGGLTAFSTCFYTWFRQIHTLRRPIHTVLPVLHAKKCPPQLCPPSTSSCDARFSDTCLTFWPWVQIDIPKHDNHLRTSRIAPSFRVSC